jgi:hypothetical protein
MDKTYHSGWDKVVRRLLNALAWLIGLVFVLHAGGQLVGWAAPADNRVVADIAARLSVDSELSVPTWTSASLALLAALLAYLIAKAQTVRQPGAVWFGIAGLMAAVSLDEVAALHELLLQGLHILAGFNERQSLLNNAWLIVLPFIAVAGVAGLRLAWRRLPAATFRRICAASAVYLSGAVVVEYLSASADKSGLGYLLGAAVIEEALEFAGLWLLVRASLLHIAEHESDLCKKLEAITAP